MITFTEFKKRLAQGQLKNTAAVDIEVSTEAIVATHEDTILTLTNQGLLDLSTRFPLFTKQIDLVFKEDQNLYSLVVAGIDDYLFELYDDTFDEDTFIKILDIFDEDGNRHIPNTNGHLLMPTYNSIRFTNAKIEDIGERVRIRFQSRHPIIAEDDNIDLPPNLETALQLFVAALFISHINGEDNIAKGNSYYGAYLRHIGDDELKDNSNVSEVDEDIRFVSRGFV